MWSGTNVGCVGGHQYAEAGGALGRGLNVLQSCSMGDIGGGSFVTVGTSVSIRNGVPHGGEVR